VRTIAKKKVIFILIAAIIGGIFIWWLFSESGSGDVNGDGMADTNVRIERARTENERAAEANKRIEESVNRLEHEQQRIESGNKSVEDVADRAAAILNADRASLERIRAVVDAVEKRRVEKANEP
jgi:small-conductance mechanosensitive channel